MIHTSAHYYIFDCLLVSHDQSVRLSDEGGNYNGFPDRWQGSQLDVEDHYVEEDRTSGDTQDASRFSAEEVVDLEDGDEDHAEEVDNEMQPLFLDTCNYSLPLIFILYVFNLPFSISSWIYCGCIKIERPHRNSRSLVGS